LNIIKRCKIKVEKQVFGKFSYLLHPHLKTPHPEEMRGINTNLNEEETIEDY